MFKRTCYIYTLIFCATYILLSSCNKNSERIDYDLPSVFADPVVVNLDTAEGYFFNPFTGDSIVLFMNYYGKEIITGKAVQISAEQVDLDTMPEPVLYPAHRNRLGRMAYPKNIRFGTIKPDSFKIFEDSLKINELNQADSSYVWIPGGDSVLAGVAIKPEPVIKPAKSFQRSKGMPPVYTSKQFGISRLGITNGLHGVTILSMLESSNGDIWFGTDGGGLSRYDGLHFSYYPGNQNLNNKFINDLIEDDDGNIWIATYLGVSCYTGDSFINYLPGSGISSDMYHALLQEKSGEIWFGSEYGGVTRFDGKYMTTYTMDQGFSANSVWCMEEDQEENIWFGTYGSGACKFDGENFIQFSEKDGLCNRNVYSILEDSKGKIWFGTENGVSCYTGTHFINYFDSNGLSSNEIYSIIEDKEGNIWFGTDGGGACYFDGNHFFRINETQGLSNNTLWSLLQDRSGNIWFGTYGKGVNRLDANYINRITEAEGISNATVWSILEDSVGNIWFGTDGYGMNLFDGDTFYHYLSPIEENDRYVNEIIQDKNGTIWFSTFMGFNCLKNDTIIHYDTRNGLSENSVHPMIFDKEGNLWMGTYDGLSCFTGDKIINYKEDGLDGVTIYGLLEDREGNIWIGTFEGGLIKYDGKHFTHYTEKEGFFCNSVLSMLEDKNGNIWFGTEGQGIIKLSEGKFYYYSKDQGITDDIIHSILEDASGNIWFGTSYSGVIKYNGETFQYFTEKEGLSNNQVLSMLEDSRGRLWLGTFDGVSKFEHELRSEVDPKQSESQKPQAQLHEIQLNDQFIDFRYISDGQHGYGKVERFRNYPSQPFFSDTIQDIRFNFFATDWEAPHRLRFSYRLLGQDNKWTEPGFETSADYRNLDHGKEYTFQVAAIGTNGIWSEPFEYTLTILPPWYETKAYYIGQTLFLAILVFFAIFFNRSRRGGQWVIVFTFITLITIFEFAIMLIEPYAEGFSAGIPIVQLVINVGLALSLNPVEKFIRKKTEQRRIKISHNKTSSH